MYSISWDDLMARHQFTRAVALEPDAWPMRNNLGIALIQSGDQDAGIEQLRVAARASPQRYRALDVDNLEANLALAVAFSPVRGESRLDTVVIEPDARRLVAVWRAAIPCPRTLLYVQYVFVKRARDARGDARAEVA